jgi:hypothetical protein
MCPWGQWREWGRGGVEGDELSLQAGCEQGSVGEGEGIACAPEAAGDAAFADVDGHARVGAEEGEYPELDGHVGGRARGEAEVISEAVSWVCGCGFCGVDVSGGGAWAVAPASHREPSKEGFKEEGE